LQNLFGFSLLHANQASNLISREGC
jgi:hypothetical protein